MGRGVNRSTGASCRVQHDWLVNPAPWPSGIEDGFGNMASICKGCVHVDCLAQERIDHTSHTLDSARQDSLQRRKIYFATSELRAITEPAMLHISAQPASSIIWASFISRQIEKQFAQALDSSMQRRYALLTSSQAHVKPFKIEGSMGGYEINQCFIELLGMREIAAMWSIFDDVKFAAFHRFMGSRSTDF